MTKNRFLVWCIYRGIVEAQEMLANSNVGDGIVMIAQMTARAAAQEAYLRHKDAMQRTISVADTLSKDGLKRQARRLLERALEDAKKLEDPEWREKFIRAIGPKLKELK